MEENGPLGMESGPSTRRFKSRGRPWLKPPLT